MAKSKSKSKSKRAKLKAHASNQKTTGKLKDLAGNAGRRIKDLVR